MLATCGLRYIPDHFIAVASCVVCVVWPRKKGYAGAVLGLFGAIGFLFTVIGTIVVALVKLKAPAA